MNIKKNQQPRQNNLPVRPPLDGPLRYFVVYKPFGMQSQFTREVPTHLTLQDLDFQFPKDAYPVGRLDADSEGLLLLTNDKDLNYKLLDPKFQHPRTYLVQVEGAPDYDIMRQLRKGVSIQVDGKTHHTLPAEASILTEEPHLPERNPPIRVRKSVPDTWVSLTLREGKNRQVRRMCAAVGFPVLRLVRVKIGNLELADMQPGDVQEITAELIAEKIFS